MTKPNCLSLGLERNSDMYKRREGRKYGPQDKLLSPVWCPMKTAWKKTAKKKGKLWQLSSSVSASPQSQDPHGYWKVKNRRMRFGSQKAYDVSCFMRDLKCDFFPVENLDFIQKEFSWFQLAWKLLWNFKKPIRCQEQNLPFCAHNFRPVPFRKQSKRKNMHSLNCLQWPKCAMYRKKGTDMSWLCCFKGFVAPTKAHPRSHKNGLYLSNAADSRRSIINLWFCYASKGKCYEDYLYSVESTGSKTKPKTVTMDDRNVSALFSIELETSSLSKKGDNCIENQELISQMRVHHSYIYKWICERKSLANVQALANQKKSLRNWPPAGLQFQNNYQPFCFWSWNNAKVCTNEHASSQRCILVEQLS